ncbi:Kinase protein with adenine nucleotide alpha hydrolases-like domain, putative isoform 4 [Hibiscus syriacus]|uniref:Kinase protein with adenine nucleotide alpha hydrolases-like domain, putative isoform 4 n=1 Tax=Hibiscus syriacus TaxID=106335 RepID=A0A6A3B0A1_HIBSY|nr:Kinase protein with adenine nucleotide alpha hydrolases-like domain, putative isoform 4 [Hibiscus syriacus]
MCGTKIWLIENNSTSWEHIWRDGFAKRELRSELAVIEATIRVGLHKLKRVTGIALVDKVTDENPGGKILFDDLNEIESKQGLRLFLHCHNAVADKILKSSKDANKDFANEIEIISSLKHKNKGPLVGVCVKDYDLISVYEFSSKGSLAEILHGKSKDKHPLPWEVRYNVAVAIAEATWGPTASSFLTRADVAGTFGYLAPDYFMHGKLSDKIDVYAFGIILLELLSGKRPISFGNHEGQQSLVMWAKPMIESGDVKGILDSDLNENINAAQMHRMVIVATLCIKRTAQLRPKMNDVLELLRGDKATEKCSLAQDENKESQEYDTDDDEVDQNSRADLHLSLAMLDVEDDSTSFSSTEQRSNISLEEYLKERWSPSSNFN